MRAAETFALAGLVSKKPVPVALVGECSNAGGVEGRANRARRSG